MYDYFKDEQGTGIIAEGSSLEKAFEEAGKAVFNLMFKGKLKPGKKEKIEVEVSGEDEEELLVNWINALLKESEMRNVVLSAFKVTKLKNGMLEGYAKGSKITIKKRIKTASHEVMEVGKKGKKFIVRFVVD